MDYLKIYNTLDSTNKEARRLLAAGQVNSGFTILARHQTEGRGQYGRVWESAPDTHLAMSVVYKPVHIDTSALIQIGMKVSLGIVRALKSTIPALNPRIKWPNDIYLENKKLSGILIENAISGSTVQHSIIGIGMNIKETQFPANLPNPTSLALATGYSYEMEPMARIIRKAILDIFEETDLIWKKEYDSSLYGTGGVHQFHTDQGNIQAKVMGVSLQGHLKLELQNGENKSFATHELKWEIT